MEASRPPHFSVGDDWVRFVTGPSIGFNYVGVSSTNVSLITVGALIGIELLSRSRLFGFRIIGRPFVGPAFASGSSGVAVSGGALLELELISYVTNG